MNNELMKQQTKLSEFSLSISCAVCDRKAEGRHYGIISCSACKSFFRRSIAFKRKYECKFNNDCMMQRNGRTLCRACRFRKCHEVGMDPIGIYDYTLKKSLHNNSDFSDNSNNAQTNEFRDQILSSYNLLLHDRKQQTILDSNFSQTMQRVPHENLIFRQFLVNTQLMEFFCNTSVVSFLSNQKKTRLLYVFVARMKAVKKKRVLRSWCVLQLLHNTVIFNGLSHNRIYHFDCSYTCLTKEGFLKWYNSSNLLFPYKSSILRLSASIWERALEIINHFQKLNLDTFELATFLIISIATSINTNSSDSKSMKMLMDPLLSRVIETLNIYYCKNSNDSDDSKTSIEMAAAVKTGNLLMFISSFVEMEIIMNEFFLQLSLYCNKQIPELFDFNE